METSSCTILTKSKLKVNVSLSKDYSDVKYTIKANNDSLEYEI